MATFTQWLQEQTERDDATGWFARYWRDLPDKKRLSSPSSIALHLEERQLMTGAVQKAYDLTLTEYRELRAQTARSVAGVGQSQQTEPAPVPSTEPDIPGETGHEGGIAAVLEPPQPEVLTIRQLLGQILDNQQTIMYAMGLTAGGMEWQLWWEQAVEGTVREPENPS